MPCRYYDQSKDNPWDGIYCNKISGRPGVSYWKHYCDGCPSDCPYNGGSDPYELHPDTRERNRVIQQIDNLPSRITSSDGSKISDARWAYGRLSYDQQRFVRNYSRLEAAERAYQTALQQEDEQTQEQYRREQESRRKAQETKPKNGTGKSSTGYTGGYRDENRPKGYVKNLITGEWHKQTLGERFVSWLSITFDPHINKPSWPMIICRIVMPVWAIWFSTLFEEGSLPLAIILVDVFTVLQLGSLILAYMPNSTMKVRIGLWAAELILVAILGLMIYLDTTGGLAVAVAWAALPAPVLMLAFKLLKWLIGVLVK